MCGLPRHDFYCPEYIFPFLPSAASTKLAGALGIYLLYDLLKNISLALSHLKSMLPDFRNFRVALSYIFVARLGKENCARAGFDTRRERARDRLPLLFPQPGNKDLVKQEVSCVMSCDNTLPRLNVCLHAGVSHNFNRINIKLSR